MESADARLRALQDLEARHDEVLRQLEELDQRVQQVLKECLGSNEPKDDVQGPV